MSCHGGTHFSCECQRELLEDALDALTHLLAGLERYREGLSYYDRAIFTKAVHGIPGAISVIRRGRRTT